MNIKSLHPVTVILLIASMPLAAASLDMFLPALPEMVSEFGTTEATIQISLSLNIIASAIFGVSSGILSDHIGRRKLFVYALFLFTLGTYLCSLASNVTFFILVRTLQGGASGVIFVLVSTIISDVYTGVKKAQVLGISTFLFPITLGIAPFIGEKIYHNYGWRATFTVLGTALLLASLMLFWTLPETKKSSSSKLSLKRIAKDAQIILSTPAFVVNALIPAIFMGAFMSFIAYSPFIYMNFFGLTSKIYVYYLITPLVFQFFTGIGYQLMIKLLGVNRMLMLGMLSASCSLILICYLLTGWISLEPVYFMLVIVFYSASIPFILPTVTSKAFDTFSEKAGTISSLSSLLRNTIMSFYIYASGVVYDGTPLPILKILTFGILSFIILSMISLRISYVKVEKSNTTFNV